MNAPKNISTLINTVLGIGIGLIVLSGIITYVKNKNNTNFKEYTSKISGKFPSIPPITKPITFFLVKIDKILNLYMPR